MICEADLEDITVQCDKAELNASAKMRTGRQADGIHPGTA
jgi:hypothetical protein